MLHKALWILLLFFSQKTLAQEYGLEFMGHEVNPDQRTSLTIGELQEICFDENFELSFELKFKKSVVSYFGYIFRMVNAENQNIDLLYNSRNTEKFRIVNKDLSLTSNFGLDSSKLYNRWSKLRFLFNHKTKELSIYEGTKFLEKKVIAFNEKNCLKIYFGGNKNTKFATKDVLPMYIRNVTLSKGAKVVNFWKLNEVSGNVAKESVNASSGIVTNGSWMLVRHYEWRKRIDSTFKGQTTFYFDRSLNHFLIHSDEGSFYFNEKKSATISRPFNKKHNKFTFGDQSYFLKESQNGVNVRLNQKEIYFYDSKTNSWNTPANLNPELTEYWHHNQYFYPKDTAIVLIGGYGQYTYKNNFQKYSFLKKDWSELKMNGDRLEPRYLFGIGHTKKLDKSYIFGGYGSKTGEQEINPQNFYDLLEINWKDLSIKRIYTLESPEYPFVAVKSMVIDEKNQVFYALIYNQLNFKSSLQLVKGSLIKPEYEIIGKPIPYDFQDVASSADLAFDEENQKLVCVTNHFDRLKNLSYDKVYTLDFPPANQDASIFQTKNNVVKWLTILAIILIVLVLLVLGIFFFRKRKSKIQLVSKSEENFDNSKIQIHAIPVESSIEKVNVRSKLILFGGFQFLTAKGEDLSVHFTPLVKELFLYLLLNSIKWNKSVNSQQLNDLFWYDKTTTSARNNRSVNLTKLKVIFEQVGHIQISKESGDWQIIFDPLHVFVDYYDFLKLTDEKKNLSKEEINLLTKIVSRGNFLFNLEYEWLEPFKSEISNRVIDAYTSYSKNLNFEADAQEIIEIADRIFVFDKVDETAMEMKCKALVVLGKHSLAQKCYEHFEKEYQLLYAEKFNKSFKQIINGI